MIGGRRKAYFITGFMSCEKQKQAEKAKTFDTN